MARYPVLLLRAASCKAAICKRSPAVSSVTRRPLCKLCEVKAAICKLVQFKETRRKIPSLYPQKFALCSLHFAVRKSRLRGHVARCSHSSSCAAYASCELQAASCNFAPRSSQLAARRFRHRAEKQSFARCTSHFALCSSCPGSVITSNCSAHLALCTSQYVHMSVLPGLQCAPRTSHLATHLSEPHFRRIIHRR